MYHNQLMQGDEKNGHSRKLKKAAENLQPFNVELLDYNSHRAAIAECNGVFDVASPVPADHVANPEVDINPAVMGTHNVVTTCSEAKVKRVVVLSFAVVVVMNPNWPKDELMVESCKKTADLSTHL
ncbi:hypothetical protein MKW98_019361 [Papaver atlanticum]|uniref:3-beta hydroxysteroid dehydrogenase/isomerase domain-containing protein n=1 Tax=Papaver atlanticum TaxID=357466 RepID=A0AAD4S875_9MAGN|nr:hypothetical protein MKW98_019361 [Papaver atlanticum]